MRFKPGDIAIYAFADCPIGEEYINQEVTIEAVKVKSQGGPVRDYQLDITRSEKLDLGLFVVERKCWLLCDDWQLRKKDDPTFDFKLEEEELEEELCTVR